MHNPLAFVDRGSLSLQPKWALSARLTGGGQVPHRYSGLIDYDRNGCRRRNWRCTGTFIGPAHDVLAGVYSRFTEGFGTADLAAAKALLQDLAAVQ
jgi:hypothetical protein